MLISRETTKEIIIGFDSFKATVATVLHTNELYVVIARSSSGDFVLCNGMGHVPLFQVLTDAANAAASADMVEDCEFIELMGNDDSFKALITVCRAHGLMFEIPWHYDENLIESVVIGIEP